jgi:hypothetical protein
MVDIESSMPWDMMVPDTPGDVDNAGTTKLVKAARIAKLAKLGKSDSL